jgi:hypothetical protein
MIRTSTLLLTAAFNLIMSALSAQAANTQLATTQAAKTSTIPISYLPYPITAPGTYVLTGNLTLTSGNLGGINVLTNVSGPVVIDLKGYTITGPGTPSSGVLLSDTGSINTYPITIRNGTISHCTSGIYVGERTDVTINNIAFIEPADLSTGANIIGVDLERSNSSTVSNCTFIVPVADTGLTAFGIIDSESTGGDSYNNDTFVNMPNSLYVTAWNSGGESPGRQTPPLSTVTLDRCQFAPPPSN